jgi:hypothetical protein
MGGSGADRPIGDEADLPDMHSMVENPRVLG